MYMESVKCCEMRQQQTTTKPQTDEVESDVITKTVLIHVNPDKEYFYKYASLL